MGGKSDAEKQNEQLMNMQMDAYRQNNELTKLQAEDYKKFRPQINAIQEASLGHTLADTKSPVWEQQRSLGEQIMGTVKDYQPIGFDNPTVQAIQGYLNDNSTAYAKDLMKINAENSAANGDFGSSFRASQNADLTDKFARMYNDNALSSLSTASQVQGYNTGLVDWAMGNRADTPTIQAPQINVPAISQYQPQQSTAAKLGGAALLGLAQNPNLGNYASSGLGKVKSMFGGGNPQMTMSNTSMYA